MIPSKYLVMLLEAIKTKYNKPKVRITTYSLNKDSIVIRDSNYNKYEFKQCEICCINLKKLERIIENK